MHRILVFSKDDNFTGRLEDAAEKRDDFELVVVDAVNLAVEALSTQEWSAVLVDESAAELDDDERAQLLSAGGLVKPVFAVSTTRLEELNDNAHLDPDASPEELLASLEKRLSRNRDRHRDARQSSIDERPESGIYFVSDTQGRSYLDSSGGLDRQTSQFEVDSAWTPTILFVGGEGDLRSEFAQVCAEQSADFIAFDAPHAVSLQTGASSIDLAVLCVEQDLSATRRLVRFLRRRQPEAPLEVVLIASAEQQLQAGLGRTLGADEVIEQPVEAAELLARASLRDDAASTTVLVVCRQVQRAEMFESALRREPVDLAVCRPEGLAAAFRDRLPDIVLFDAASTDVDAMGLVDTLKKDHPFASTHYLIVAEASNREQSAARKVFDGVLNAPVLPSDIRQLIRLHLAHVGMGRAALERDRLTDVNSTLALGDDLEAMLARAESSGQSVVLTGVDVDNLGLINGRYGKAVGDSVLRSLADALHLAAGDRAAIYRTDADEFFVLQYTDEDRWPTMRERIDRALHVFRQQTFRSADGRGTYATASAGSVLVPPSRISAEICLQKCWIVLERAAATHQERVLVARIDPSALSDTALSRDRSDKRK